MSLLDLLKPSEPIIKLKRGSLKEWQEANPILLEAELIYVTDEKTFRIGDEKTRFNDLKVWNECIPFKGSKLYTSSGENYNLKV